MRPGRRAWTPNEDALLLRLFLYRKNIEVMAWLLDRSLHAVQARLSTRRLVRQKGRIEHGSKLHRRMRQFT